MDHFIWEVRFIRKQGIGSNWGFLCVLISCLSVGFFFEKMIASIYVNMALDSTVYSNRVLNL